MRAIARNILLHHLHPSYVSRKGRPRHLELSYILDRIAYVPRTGCQWANLPVENRSWKTIYHYFAHWSKHTSSNAPLWTSCASTFVAAEESPKTSWSTLYIASCQKSKFLLNGFCQQLGEVRCVQTAKTLHRRNIQGLIACITPSPSKNDSEKFHPLCEHCHRSSPYVKIHCCRSICRTHQSIRIVCSHNGFLANC